MDNRKMNLIANSAMHHLGMDFSQIRMKMARVFLSESNLLSKLGGNGAFPNTFNLSFRNILESILDLDYNLSCDWFVDEDSGEYYAVVEGPVSDVINFVKRRMWMGIERLRKSGDYKETYALVDYSLRWRGKRTWSIVEYLPNAND